MENQADYAIDPTPLPPQAPRILTADLSEQVDGLLTCNEYMLALIRRLEDQVVNLKGELHGLTARYESHSHPVPPYTYSTNGLQDNVTGEISTEEELGRR